jgi:hypothetical protein
VALRFHDTRDNNGTVGFRKAITGLGTKTGRLGLGKKQQDGYGLCPANLFLMFFPVLLFTAVEAGYAKLQKSSTSLLLPTYLVRGSQVLPRPGSRINHKLKAENKVFSFN